MVKRFSRHVLTTACLIYSTASISASFGQSTEDQPEPKAATKRAQLSVDQMIRQPIDQMKVFAKVRAADESMLPALPEPTVRTSYDSTSAGQAWSSTGYCWQSPAFCYSPLYFEQPNLERYGTGPGPFIAPAASASAFFANVVAFPVKSLHHPWWSKDCTLGNHRPGNCTPHQRHVSHDRRPNDLLARNANVNRDGGDALDSQTGAVSLASNNESSSEMPIDSNIDFRMMSLTPPDTFVIPPEVHVQNPAPMASGMPTSPVRK
jgi:hypothetical protein